MVANRNARHKKIGKPSDSYDLPTVDNSNRFAEDQKFRKLGWRIEARPKHGEPVWTRTVYYEGCPKVERATQSEIRRSLRPGDQSCSH